jgi:hypothetical protein
MRSTVVTLSRKAESTAVVTDSIKSIIQGCARPFFADHTARYSNMPQRREIETSIIMPVRSAMVLKSTPLIASFWSRTPTTIISPAPSRAMIERLRRSVTMST